MIDAKILGKGLHCNIMQDKSIGNCSNGGISERVDSVIVLTDVKEAQVFQPREGLPAVVIKKMSDGYVYAEPVEPCSSRKPVGYMAGGTFIYSSDSRWKRITGVDYPISLHDRCETQEDYDILSR